MNNFNNTLLQLLAKGSRPANTAAQQKEMANLMMMGVSRNNALKVVEKTTNRSKTTFYALARSVGMSHDEIMAYLNRQNNATFKRNLNELARLTKGRANRLQHMQAYAIYRMAGVNSHNVAISTIKSNLERIPPSFFR